MASGMPLGSVIVKVTSHLPSILCVCRHPRARKCQVEHPPGHFSITFKCLSVLLHVFVVISISRGTNYLRHDLADGDFVDVRRLILHHSRDFMSVSASSVVFCSVFISAPLKHTRAMAAPVETSACAAAASIAEDEVSTASGGASSVASSPGTPVAKAKAKAAVGRPRGGKKPQIDIDVEIQEADKLAELFKKMQKASKVAARNSTRQRQRLVRKAHKLSEQDLRRLAVIKRFGMFVPDTPDFAASASGADGGPLQGKKSKLQEQLSTRFKTLVSGVAGAAELCEALTVGTASSAAATAPSTPIVVSSPVAKQLLRLRAPVLQRLPSQLLTLRVAVPSAVAADEDDGEGDEEDHEMETAESAEGGGE